MLGPDGKPLNIRAGQIVGGPKSLDDVEPFNAETIKALEDGAVQLLQSGQPMEVPAAMPMIQIVQIAKTLQVQRERIEELEKRIEEREEPGGKTENGLPGPLSSKLDLSGLTFPSGPEVSE
jgi:hypothetical protein